MTLHTRVAVTSGDVTPEAVFAQCRSIIGADKHQVIEGDPLAMALGQGLPALLNAAWQDARDHGYDDDDRPTLNEAREDDWRDEHGMWMESGQWPTEASC